MPIRNGSSNYIKLLYMAQPPEVFFASSVYRAEKALVAERRGRNIASAIRLEKRLAALEATNRMWIPVPNKNEQNFTNVQIVQNYKTIQDVQGRLPVFIQPLEPKPTIYPIPIYTL